MNFSSTLKLQKVGVVRLLFKLKLNEFHFYNNTVRSSLWNKHFQEKYNIKSHSLSGSRMVGEAFLKSLSIEN